MHIGTITKLELLKTAKGHQPHVTGTGIWRNRRKSPKGGRRTQTRKAIGEF